MSKLHEIILYNLILILVVSCDDHDSELNVNVIPEESHDADPYRKKNEHLEAYRKNSNLYLIEEIRGGGFVCTREYRGWSSNLDISERLKLMDYSFFLKDGAEAILFVEFNHSLKNDNTVSSTEYIPVYDGVVEIGGHNYSLNELFNCP